VQGGLRVSDYDSPWKEALALYFPWFMAFFFPQAYEEIDWSRPYEVLDKELQQVTREAEQGRRVADMLFKIWLKDGREEWVLVHVEVQSQFDTEFPRRMFVFNYRLFDLYNRVVVSLAVLGDEDCPNWLPNRFGYQRWGCRVEMEFPVVKLLDYRNDLAALEQNPNPFAVVVLTHLKTQETKGDPEARRQWKLRLVKGLYQRGFSANDVRELFRLIDWMMDLPKDLNNQFWQDYQQFEQEKHMPYVTSVERIAIEKGRQEGRQEGLRLGILKAIAPTLKLRFAEAGIQFLDEIKAIEDLTVLEALPELANTAESLDELRQFISKHSAN
jgi:hypothetical protein